MFCIAGAEKKKVQFNRLIFAFAIGLAACSAARPDPSIYKVGDLEVRLYRDTSILQRDLVGARLIAPIRIGTRTLEIRGYYDRAGKRIYSINDPVVLLHEIKHYLVPEWRHPLGQPGLEAAQ